MCPERANTTRPAVGIERFSSSAASRMLRSSPIVGMRQSQCPAKQLRRRAVVGKLHIVQLRQEIRIQRPVRFGERCYVLSPGVS